MLKPRSLSATCLFRLNDLLSNWLAPERRSRAPQPKKPRQAAEMLPGQSSDVRHDAAETTRIRLKPAPIGSGTSASITYLHRHIVDQMQEHIANKDRQQKRTETFWPEHQSENDAATPQQHNQQTRRRA